MRLLALTFDAAGNLPPMLGLIEALVARGHSVDVLGHQTQCERIAAAGGRFIGFECAEQRDSSAPPPPNVTAWLAAFDLASRDDLLAQAEQLQPDALIVDAMTPAALAAANGSRWPSVALCHAPYQALLGYMDGRYRAPLEGAGLVVVTSYEAFHAGPPAPTNVVFSGPARPAPTEAWSPKDRARPLILASLSTGQQGQEPVLRRLCEALRDVDAEVLVTSGRGIAPETLPSAPHMTIARIIPHEAVLPFASLLITHAGHGTAMAGMRAGAPMLCLPGLGDQPGNAARIAELGLGEVADTNAEPAILRETIGRLLADEGLRARCRAFATALEAAPGLEQAVARIEELAS